MGLIASEVDHAHVAHTEGWHTSLLKRIANPFPGVREAVISDATYTILDHLRSFRHRERNTYGLSLDSAIVVERAHEAVEAFTGFRDDIASFMSRHQST
jgi:hypothetical protein